MAQYIDKNALVAEIERISDNAEEVHNSGYVLLCNHLKSFLNTLEVKEVDLEKEVELVKGDYEQVDIAWNNDFDFIAKHFFELGLKAQKGE